MTPPGWGWGSGWDRLTRRNALSPYPVIRLLTLDAAGWGENATGSGSLPSITISAATGSGSGDASASGALAQIAVTFADGSASGSATGSGSLAQITVTAPDGYATITGQVVTAPWSLSAGARNAGLFGDGRNLLALGDARNIWAPCADHNLVTLSIMRGPDYTSDMAIVGTLTKQPAETLLVEYDFSAQVGTRTLTSATVVPTVPTGVTISDSAQAGTVFQMWVAGGTHLQTYKISLTVTLVIAGHTEVIQDEVMILVEEV